jgi:hypothetical protein
MAVEVDRVARLRAALEAELGRQGVMGADTDRLARIALELLDGPTDAPDEGKRPAELNATNDD